MWDTSYFADCSMNLPLVSIISRVGGTPSFARACRCIETALVLLVRRSELNCRSTGTSKEGWRNRQGVAIIFDFFWGCRPTLIPNSKSNDNIKRQSSSSASRRMATKATATVQQLQKRNAGSLHCGDKCATSGQDDGVLLIPKRRLRESDSRLEAAGFPSGSRDFDSDRPCVEYAGQRVRTRWLHQS